MKVITIASTRGGVGKTTLTANLAFAFAGKKKRVLVLDLDSQSSLTDFFLRSVSVDEIMKANAYHVLSERMSAAEAIRKDDLFIHVLPGSVKLHTLGAEMSGEPGALLRTVKELRSLPYDVCLIDTPPGLSYEFRVGIYAADLVLSPVTLDRWAVQGLALLKNEMAKAQKSGVKQTLKVVPSIVTDKEAETLAKLPDSLTPPVLKSAAVKTAMNKGAKLKEAHKSSLQFVAVAEAIL